MVKASLYCLKLLFEALAPPNFPLGYWVRKHIFFEHSVLWKTFFAPMCFFFLILSSILTAFLCLSSHLSTHPNSTLSFSISLSKTGKGKEEKEVERDRLVYSSDSLKEEGHPQATLLSVPQKLRRKGTDIHSQYRSWSYFLKENITTFSQCTIT